MSSVNIQNWFAVIKFLYN